MGIRANLRVSMDVSMSTLRTLPRMAPLQRRAQPAAPSAPCKWPRWPSSRQADRERRKAIQACLELLEGDLSVGKLRRRS
jgi:hypothetical protein